jgi:hypothetical protein
MVKPMVKRPRLKKSELEEQNKQMAVALVESAILWRNVSSISTFPPAAFKDVISLEQQADKILRTFTNLEELSNEENDTENKADNN